MLCAQLREMVCEPSYVVLEVASLHLDLHESLILDTVLIDVLQLHEDSPLHRATIEETMHVVL